jgi:hypothetical protein
VRAKQTWILFGLGVALALGAAGPATSATNVESVQSGTLAMTSDPGDYIGQGGSYSFATPENEFFASSDATNTRVAVSVRPDPAGDVYWVAVFAAPSGQPLLPGTYGGAQRAGSADPAAPGLEVYGDFRACNTVSGSFTVLEAAYGPDGYVESFHATFEQHCEGFAPALRGEVVVSNPPPPPPIGATVTIDAAGKLTASGSALVHGTISCTRQPDPDRSYLQLVLSEPTKKGTITGAAAISPPSCPSTPVAWQAIVSPTDPRAPFVKGATSMSAVAHLYDPFYEVGRDVDTETATVLLKEG